MTSKLFSLIQRLYPRNESERVLITGLDYSGKTTLLYLLKLGEVVTTIPSIGFNVETIEMITSSKKRLQLDAWDVGGGCGGSSMMRMMLRHYMPGAKAIIWVVDSADKERIAEAVEALQGVLFDLNSIVENERKHIPVLVLANKTDLPNCMSLDEIRVKFSKPLSGTISAIYPTSLTKKPPTGLDEAFDWLALALDIAKTTKKSLGGPPPSIEITSKATTPQPAAAYNPRDAGILAKKLEEWLRRAESDSAPEEFMEQFKAYQLPSWDHYVHIRLAYLILVAHGRQKGKDMLFQGLSDYIENSAQTNGRAFHLTMTYFWLQIVHFGIRNLPEHFAPQVQTNADFVSTFEDASGTEADIVTLVESAPAPSPIGIVNYPTSTDFFRFLLVNPHVVDGNLWLDYYTKEVMMSPDAKERMALPDKKPLPSLVIRDAISSFGAKPLGK